MTDLFNCIINLHCLNQVSNNLFMSVLRKLVPQPSQQYSKSSDCNKNYQWSFTSLVKMWIEVLEWRVVKENL